MQPLKFCQNIETVELKVSQNIGAVILAGGDGSRLGHIGPKGTYEVMGVSLFERLIQTAPIEKFPIAIMTSPKNHKETRAFFEKHEFFQRELFFFQQEEAAVLSQKGRPLPAKAPLGNGDFFRSFASSGCLTLFQEKGIQDFMVVPVDNPKAHLADPLLLSWHQKQKACVTVQCIENKKQRASMGALMEEKGKVQVLEYLYLNPAESYRYFYTGIQVFSLNFVAKVAQVSLPIHRIQKILDGNTVYKKEKFLFDSFPFAKRIEAVCVPDECYIAIKNKEHVLEFK